MIYVIYKNTEVFEEIDTDKPHNLWDNQKMGETGDDLVSQYCEDLNWKNPSDYFTWKLFPNDGKDDYELSLWEQS